MADTLSQVLAGLTASDVEVDESGRIVIKNPEVARQLQDLSVEAKPTTNSNCNHHCKPSAEQ